MNTPMNPEPRRPLRTSDLATAGDPPATPDDVRDEADGQTQSRTMRRTASESVRSQEATELERLEALFPPDVAERYRTRWADVQSGFVDDPRRAVTEGD